MQQNDTPPALHHKRFNCKTLFAQFMKFGVVGVSNTLISLGVYYLLLTFGCHYLLANAAGFVLSVLNSYFWNSRFIFRDKLETSGWRALGKVFLSYGVSFGLSTVLMLLFVQVLHISAYLAPVLRLVLTVPLNFVMNKLWAFKDHGGIGL
ncbi:MAG: GtrA family protein [Christensenella sp.]|nr:GtrA family protein [Christensenella sp.]